MILHRTAMAAAMILGMAATAFAQWSSPLAPVPGATATDALGRSNHCAAAFGGKVYVFGGQSDWGNTSATAIYDPTTDSWTMDTAILTHRLYAAAVTLGSEIYVVGGFAGYTASAKCESFNPATGLWTPRDSMDTPRNFPAAVALAGRIHVIGGNNGGAGISSHEAYDPGSDRWSPLAVFPSAQGASDLGAAAIDGRIYTLGGNIPFWGNTFNCHRYDPADDRWTDLQVSGFPGRGLSCAAMGRRMYSFGGEWSSQVISFHPRSLAVDAGIAPMTEGRSYATAVTVGSLIYVMGGEDYDGYYRNNNYAFTPPTVGAAPSILSMNQTRNGGTQVPAGAITSLPLTVQVNAADPDGGLLTLEIEARPAGGFFTGEPTLISAPQPANLPVVADLIGLASGGWQWQARVADEQDNLCPWVEFTAGSGGDFVVDNTPPSTPSLVSPVGGVTIGERRLTLRWTAASDASGISNYEVQVAQDPGFAMLVANRQVTGTELSISLSNGRYFWRALATDGGGLKSAWSSTEGFIVYEDIDHAAGDATKVCGFSAPASGGWAWLLLAFAALAGRRGMK